MAFSQLGGYVRSRIGGKALRFPINCQATQQWLRSATLADITTMLDSNPNMDFVSCTIGPKDLMYSPAGWVRVELPQQEDNIMVRCTVPADAGSDVLQELSTAMADYLVMGKKNVALEFAHTKLKELAAAAAAPTPKAGTVVPASPAALGAGSAAPLSPLSNILPAESDAAAAEAVAVGAGAAAPSNLDAAAGAATEDGAAAGCSQAQPDEIAAEDS